MKNRYVIASVMIVSLVAGSSCSGPGPGSSEGYLSDVDFIPVQMEGSAKVSLWSPKTGVVAENELDDWCTVVTDGVSSATSWNTGSTKLFTFDGKNIEIVPGCDNLAVAGRYSDGLIPVVKKNGRISVVDKKGDVRFEAGPVDYSEIIISSPGYCDGLLRVKNDKDKVGYLDRNGNVAIELRYTDGSDFNEGYAAVLESDGDRYSGWNIIDAQGNVVTRVPDGMWVNSKCIGGRFLCLTENLPVFIDKSGNKTAVAPNMFNVINFNKSVYVATNIESLSMGAYDFEGRQVVPCEYSQLEIMKDGGFVGVRDNRMYIIDADGKVCKTVDGPVFIQYLGHLGISASNSDGSNHFYDNKGDMIENANFAFTSVVPDNGNLHSHYFNQDGLEDFLVGLIHKDAVGKYKFGSGNDIFQREPTEADTRTQLYTVKNAFPESGFDVTVTYAFLSPVACADGNGGYEWNKTAFLDCAEVHMPLSCDITPDWLRELSHAISEKSNKRIHDFKYNDMLKRSTPWGGYEYLSLGSFGKTVSYHAFPQYGILQLFIGNNSYVSEFSDKFIFASNRSVKVPEVDVRFHDEMGSFPISVPEEGDCEGEYDEFIPDDYDFGQSEM